MKVSELIQQLKGYDPDMMVRHGRYDTWNGRWTIDKIGFDTLLTDAEGTEDITDRERDRDIQTLILY